MKKKLLYLLLLVNSIIYSQTLEHTYSTSEYVDNSNVFSAFNIDGEIYYQTLDSSTNQIKIYNSSHNLYKTITLTLDSGFKVYKLFYPSDKLFNLDSKIEFMVMSRRQSPSKNNYAIFNEDGDNLFNLNNVSRFKLYKTPQKDYKLIIYNGSIYGKDSTYRVYGLDGTLSTAQENLLSKSIKQFPNPTSKTLNITNPLKNNESDKIEVYDTNGRKFFEKEVIGNGKNIELDVSSLNKGIYIYHINNFSNKFVKN